MGHSEGPGARGWPVPTAPTGSEIIQPNNHDKGLGAHSWGSGFQAPGKRGKWRTSGWDPSARALREWVRRVWSRGDMGTGPHAGCKVEGSGRRAQGAGGEVQVSGCRVCPMQSSQGCSWALKWQRRAQGAGAAGQRHQRTWPLGICSWLSCWPRTRICWISVLLYVSGAGAGGSCFIGQDGSVR